MLEPTVAPAPKIAICRFRPSIFHHHRGLRTSIAQLLAELFTALLELALLSWLVRVRGRSTLADVQRHVSVVRSRRHSSRSLLFNDIHIGPGENTLHASTLVATAPPYKRVSFDLKLTLAIRVKHTVLVHVLDDLDAIIRCQRQVALVGRGIGIQGCSETKDRRDLGVSRRGLRRWGGILVVQLGFLIE